MKPHSFESLLLPQKGPPQGFSVRYRVYKNGKEFMHVDAGTALEALKASGLTEAYKIERDTIDAATVIDTSTWVNPAVDAATQQPVQENAPASPLSHDEVNKLLNN